MKGVFVQTFGCQMNASDSDRMKALLAPLGYLAVERPEDAELVLINTCSIREKAEQKMNSVASDLKRLKERRPELVLGVTGCVAQQEKEAIRRELPFVDIVLGPDNIDELPWALEQVLRPNSEAYVRTEFDREARVWNTRTEILNPGVSAFVSVMKGCDHFCSYCIVPHVRGREKSRPIQDVIADVKLLVSQGVKEITFLGQNINTFGKRAGESLHELFYRAHDIPGLERIRFTTSHPGDLKDELIRCFQELPRLCSYFHLPVQSGSDRILRTMRRFYSIDQYRERVGALRQARPDIAFSTDFIVGFPGETEEDFLQTLALAEEIRYDNVYAFLYSPRPGTSAAEREDPTPASVKLERLSRLQKLSHQVSCSLHAAEVGQIREILIEGPSKKDPSRLTGRTSQNVPCHLNPEDSQGLGSGDLVEVLILGSALTHLSGRLAKKELETEVHAEAR
jgi:tRNA-2-methylthio-N6-dimethylallyladenosine synthase